MRILSHAMWMTPDGPNEHADNCPCFGTEDEWLTDDADRSAAH